MLKSHISLVRIAMMAMLLSVASFGQTIVQGNTTFTTTGVPALGSTMNFEICAPANHFVCIMVSQDDTPTPIPGFTNMTEAPIFLPAEEAFDTVLMVPGDCMSIDIDVPCLPFLDGRTVYVWPFSVDMANPTIINSLPVQALTFFDDGNSGQVDVALFDDANGNGTKDSGEADLAGIPVTLNCAGPDGAFGTSDDGMQSGTTDAAGSISFMQVLTGPCTVEFDTSSLPGAVSQTSGETSFVLDPCGQYSLVAGFAPALAGGQGCTPGYWKQPHHFVNWPAAYSPNMLFSDVFEDAFPGKTLRQVLSQGGGGLKALGRHTVAALLNAGNANVSYAFTEVEVINMFNMLFPNTKPNYTALKNIFNVENERGCGL